MIQLPATTRPFFEVKCRAGVWSVYRNGRATHRSRDDQKILAVAWDLAEAEAKVRGRPVTVGLWDDAGNGPGQFTVIPWIEPVEAG